MSDFDASFKVKTPPLPHKWTEYKPQPDERLKHILPTSAFTSSYTQQLCTRVCERVRMCACLFGFVWGYVVSVWVNANDRAARPGIKTAIQTDWARGQARPCQNTNWLSL